MINASDSQLARLLLLLDGSLPAKDRDEDDVVDAQHNLQRGQREERYPDLRVGKPVHGAAEGVPVTVNAPPGGFCVARRFSCRRCPAPRGMLFEAENSGVRAPRLTNLT